MSNYRDIIENTFANMDVGLSTPSFLSSCTHSIRSVIPLEKLILQIATESTKGRLINRSIKVDILINEITFQSLDSRLG
jgi:hypothetical protein